MSGSSTVLTLGATALGVKDDGHPAISVHRCRIDSPKNPAMRSRALHLMPIAILMAVTGLPSTAAAANRCTDAQGRVTFQDAPCPDAGNAAPPVGRPGTGTAAQPTAADGYANARGSWRGPAQLHVVEGATRDLGAHRVVPMVIELGVDGKVQGVIPEAGCKLSGLTSTFVNATSASVDVTLTGCQDARFNTRMRGHLFVHSGPKEARLNLRAHSMLPTRAMRQLSLDAVLRR
jgi:hypothetical protein